MNILVFLEHHDGQLQKGSLGVLAKALTLDGASISAVVVGAQDGLAAAEQARIYGATKIYAAIEDSFDPPLPQVRVDALTEVVKTGAFDTVLFSNSVLAADIAAGLSARLDAGLNWDLVDLQIAGDELVAKRFALQDSVLVDVGWKSAIRLALFRSGSFDADFTEHPSAEIERVTVPIADHSRGTKIVEQEMEPNVGPSLEDAEIIVSGGIGVGSAENFTLVEELAKALGGAVGATRAVVYARWYPQSAQIGQTGKTVTPKLYLALGISGATQHKVGMQNSKVIVAINNDFNAPIFEFSDLSVVGDLHSIVPQLTELIAHHKIS